MSKARNLADVIVDAGGDINSASLDNVTPASVSDKTNTSTGAFDLPAGTTAQRPGSPHNGQTRFNTTTGSPEWYDSGSGSWINFSVGLPIAISYLVAAGGGGGGWAYAGAGGAGGLLTGSINLSSGQSYSITVGAGGAGALASAQSFAGSNSSLSGFALTTISSVGGGGGQGAAGANTVNGGSGGGAVGFGGGGAGGNGTSGQGSNGGAGGSAGGGGGGGAGAVGLQGRPENTSIWYDDNLKVFRQVTPNSWEEPLAELGNYL